jgi:hypothetical protein
MNQKKSRPDAPPPRVNREDIEAWLALDERRKSLNRQSEQLEKEQKAIGARLVAYVRAKEPDKLRKVTNGFLVAIKMVKGGVSWKPEFVRVAGAAAAEQLIAAAPQRESLVVEPAA